eukprot:jgi/Orpsp1_1/1184275/evm.model.c7180000088864.1
MVNLVFNPGDNNYKKILSNEYYVDKSDLIIDLNKNVNSMHNYICITLPKHFGKTFIIDMITVYY